MPKIPENVYVIVIITSFKKPFTSSLNSRKTWEKPGIS